MAVRIMDSVMMVSVVVITVMKEKIALLGVALLIVIIMDRVMGRTENVDVMMDGREMPANMVGKGKKRRKGEEGK